MFVSVKTFLSGEKEEGKKEKSACQQMAQVLSRVGPLNLRLREKPNIFRRDLLIIGNL